MQVVQKQGLGGETTSNLKRGQLVMRLLKIVNQPNQPRYGELVLLGNDGRAIVGVVYDGKGHHNYPSRVHGDYMLAKSELATYGDKAVLGYMQELKKHYEMQVMAK